MRKMIRRPLCLICLVFLFAVYVYTEGSPPKPEWDVDKAAGHTVTAAGTVSDRQVKNGTLTVYIRDVTFAKGSESDTKAGPMFPPVSKGVAVKLPEKDSENIRMGSVIEVRGVFEPFERPRVEGQFDQRTYYMVKGYEGRITRARLEAVSAGYDLIPEALRRLRDRSVDILLRNMSEEDAGLVAAMTLGDKSILDQDIKELYQRAGISHVLALSGLHIASVGLALVKLLGKTGLSKGVSSSAAFVLIAVYAVMTGLSTSTVRAVIMFGLFVLSGLCARSYDLLSAAAAAALIMIAIDPMSIYDTGFLLSFGAVLGIACIYPVFAGLFDLLPQKLKEQHLPAKAASGIAVSVSVTVATLPVIGQSFMQISLCSVILNLAVIPLMGLVLLTGFAGILAGNLGADPALILKITHYILLFFEESGRFFEKIDGNILIIGKPEKWQIITYAFIVIIPVFTRNIGCNDKNTITHPDKSVDRTGLTYTIKTARYFKNFQNKISYDIESEKDHEKKDRKKSATSVITAVTILPAAALLMIHPRCELEIRNVDVGQGDCALVWGDDIPVIMIDGGSSDIKQVGKNRIIPVLKANRIPAVDYCFLTHMDSDHISGVKEMIEDRGCGIGIRNIVVSRRPEWLLSAASKYNINIITMSAGDVLQLKGARIVCSNPAGGGKAGNGVNKDSTDENDSSLVLTMEYGSFSAVFTGDIGESVERDILPAISDCDYLKVAHHGSRNSSCADFLKKASPEVSVISAGVGNSYGHPHDETLCRLNEAGSRIYTTADTGEVITMLEDGALSVVTLYKTLYNQ